MLGSETLEDCCLHYRFAVETSYYGVPKGIRTPVAAVKGQCPRPLDDGDIDWCTTNLLSATHYKVPTLPSNVVELGGIEPPTPCMPCKCSPS